MDRLFEKARDFIYRNARPLDFARWRFHFEGGGKEEVLAALSLYQNGSGGFARALEADSWNPNAAPIQTWAATEILSEIDFFDCRHPVVRGILRYLESGEHFDGHLWQKTVESNNDYPHAPWWRHPVPADYNPTASLAGFLLHVAPRESAAHQLGLRICREAIDAFLNGGMLEAMHTTACYVQLLDHIKDAGVPQGVRFAEFEEKLRGQVLYNITADTSAWPTAYICKPSLFFSSPASVFYADNREVAAYECTFIRQTQLEDGSWDINWSWAAYPEEWAVSKNWWKSNGILKNLLYLKGIGQL